VSLTLKLDGDAAADWERFRSECANYEIVTELADGGNANKWAAVFLASVDSAAHAVSRIFKFGNETDKSDVAKITEAFERQGVREANVT
jgi:hypothetical protein